jgi:hypothetical protein
MATILNLTQHVATTEQVASGVVEPTDKMQIQKLLTFDELPTTVELELRAFALASTAKDDPGFEGSVMIGGAPYFMATLEHTLRVFGIRALHAFSRRESIDEAQADGSIKKTQVFRHAGFIEVKG